MNDYPIPHIDQTPAAPVWIAITPPPADAANLYPGWHADPSIGRPAKIAILAASHLAALICGGALVALL